MKILIFLGLLFKNDEADKIAKKSRNGVLQNQVNTFQWNCIEGIYQNGVNDLCIINALPVGTYPNWYSDIVLPSKEWFYNGNKNFQIGCLNLPILKQWMRYRVSKKLIKSLKEKEILIYSPYQPYLKAIKNLDKSYKITLIVPDLPEYYDYSKVGLIRKILRRLNNRLIDKYMSRVDRFVLFTEHMKDPLDVGNRPYTIVEGICSSKPSDYVRNRSIEKKIILYTGSLNKQFGIDVLIDAFGQIIGDDYELWICGSGDYQEELKIRESQDNRIKLFGFVSKDKVLELQSKATVLVNPRQNSGEYTKYSFPSKTMEYLLSGVPIVAYKLDGIPDEYDKYFNYVYDNSPETLAKVLTEVCECTTGHYEAVAKEAIKFVLYQKNPKKQSAKILNLVLKEK